MYQQGFFNSNDIEILLNSVISNCESSELKNIIRLNNVDTVIQKLTEFFKNSMGIEVDFIQSYIFLASETTMVSRMISNDQGWHIDGTSQVIDGDCYNVWIPIYNDSYESGVEVISEEQNPDIYNSLGDPTYPVNIYTKNTASWIFKVLQEEIPEDTDLIIVKPHNGVVLSLELGQVNTWKCNHPEIGDIAIFKQTEIHRGFHSDGIRIQLSLKFKTKDAKLNAKPSNTQYQLFKVLSKGSDDYEQFCSFQEFLSAKPELSKHGRLERQAIVSLLKSELLRVKYMNNQVPVAQ